MTQLKPIPLQVVLEDLCRRMAAEPSFVGKRRWGLRTFERCFVGKDAVTWLSGSLGISREEAILMGQDCLEEGLLNHVLGEQKFADESYYYRFHWDGSMERRVMAGQITPPSLAIVSGLK